MSKKYKWNTDNFMIVRDVLDVIDGEVYTGDEIHIIVEADCSYTIIYITDEDNICTYDDDILFKVDFVTNLKGEIIE